MTIESLFKIVDIAIQKWKWNNMKYYHGGTSILNFNGSGHSSGTGLWLTSNKDNAISYINTNSKNGIACLAEIEINELKNPFIVDFKGKTWNIIPNLPEEFKQCKTADDIVRKAKNLGYDSIIFNNVVDTKGQINTLTANKYDMNAAFRPSTNIVITRPDQIKNKIGYSIQEIPDVIKESIFYFDY